MPKLRRGVHPLHEIAEGKSLSNQGDICQLVVPSLLRVPLSQHIGATCEPVVQEGQRVLRYQVIGEVPEGKLGARVHSPVSGTVAGIKESRQISGKLVPCVVIENDFADECAPPDWECGDVESLTPEQIVAAARGAGLVGMGGAAFPTHVKLAPRDPVDTLLVNAAECEPYLTCDERTILEYTDDLLIGACAAAKAVGAKRMVVGIEKNKPAAVERLRQAGKAVGLTVIPLPVMYPQGGEKQLIFTTLRRTVPMGGLPSAVGVVVQNVGTLTALAQALRGIPCVERVVTVSGDAVKNPGNYLVRVGASMDDVFKETGGFRARPGKLITGGPMMGAAQQDLKPAVKKATSGLLALTDAQATFPPEGPCIRCGLCHRVCPMHLMPTMLFDAGVDGDAKLAVKRHIGACFECGACAYTCPAKRPLVQGIRQAKTAVAKQKEGEK